MRIVGKRATILATHWLDKSYDVHCEGVESGDYMLCGLAPEGENGDESMIKTTARISCKSCLGIIKFCKSIPKRELAA